MLDLAECGVLQKVLTKALIILSKMLLVWVFIALTRMQLFIVFIKLNLMPITLTIMLTLIKVPLLLIKVLSLPKVMMEGLNDMINPNQQDHKLQGRICVIR